MNEGMRHFCATHPTGIIYGTFIPLVIVLLALFRFKHSHPHNLILLAIFTALEAWTIGVVCALYYEGGAGLIVIQAFGITMTVFLCLTIYTLQTR
jgi:FtsH-binding integral membrane protein